MSTAAEALAGRVRETGLLPAGEPVVVLLSGGRDSVCLLDLAVLLARPGSGHARCTSTTACATESDGDAGALRGALPRASRSR